MESEIEALFYNNTKQLKKLFEALHPIDHKISVQEFLIFCKNVRIHPELLSINDIKKLVQDLVSKGISFGNMQSLLRLLAEQSFSTTSSVSDKLRMLFIHIRSPCKLFYQVSLNFNIQDSDSEELEVDQMDYNKIKSLKSDDLKSVKSRYLSKSPDSISEKYPKSVNLASTGKNQTDIKKAFSSEKSVAIKERIERFKNDHRVILNSQCSSMTSKKIGKRREYIFKMREKVFASNIVLRILFNA